MRGDVGWGIDGVRSQEGSGSFRFTVIRVIRLGGAINIGGIVELLG